MFNRHRRLRKNIPIQEMIQENHIRVTDFIYPLFVVEGTKIKREIPSMPGIYHFSLDRINQEVHQIVQAGIRSVIIFGIPESKDENGSQAYELQGIVQKAIRQLREAFPTLYIVADTCLCQFTSHGHCGIVENGEIKNDLSLEKLVDVAVSQAKAGADMIAPSNMMDGFVLAIRKGLDQSGLEHVPILSYAVKYASNFYGPFRDAVNSSPQFGDRHSYQMNPANAREAIREASSDVVEGADLLMVKPGLSYLDILYRIREKFLLPVVAYQVSGEYSMIKAAVQKGWIDERAVVMEMMLSFKRAGADLIITYYAKEIAGWLKGGDEG